MEFLKISGIVSSVIGFVLANFFVIFAFIESRVRKRRDPSYILIAFFFLGSSMAAFGQTMLYYFNTNAPASRFWEQIMHSGLFILTPVWVHFISHYFFHRKFSFVLGVIYAANLAALILTFTTQLLFIKEGYAFKQFISFTAGPLYNPFLGFFFLVISVAFVRTIVSFKASTYPLANKLFFVIGSAAAILTGSKDLLETWWQTPLPQLFSYGVLVAAFMHFAILLSHIRDMDREYDRQRDMDGDLSLAQNIQRYFVPPRFEMDNWNYQLSAVNRPGQYLSGDFYKVVQYSPHEFMFYLGDVTGKGVGASLYMTFLFSYFNSIRRIASPDDLDAIVTKANLIMKENSQENMFVTLFIGLVDLKAGRMHFVNAGHLYPPFFTGQDRKELVLLNTAGMPLGIEPDQQFRHDTVPLHDQDVLCLYTDGLSRAFDQNGIISGEDYLHNLVKLRLLSAPSAMVDGIVKEHSKMTGKNVLADDYTLMVFKIKALG